MFAKYNYIHSNKDSNIFQYIPGLALAHFFEPGYSIFDSYSFWMRDGFSLECLGITAYSFLGFIITGAATKKKEWWCSEFWMLARDYIFS